MISATAPIQANTVIAQVTDLNFHALKLFLSRLDKPTKGSLSDFGQTRQLRIELTITKTWCNNPDMESYSRWCRWAKARVEKGGSLRATYMVKAVEDNELTMERMRHFEAGNGRLDVFEGVLGAFWLWNRYGNDPIGGRSAEWVELNRRRAIASGEGAISIE